MQNEQQPLCLTRDDAGPGKRPARHHPIRPLCGCGCGKEVPLGNSQFINRQHRGRAHMRQMRAEGKMTGFSGWKKGGNHWRAYTKRVREAIEKLVPQQQSFTRQEVLLIAARARTRGYETAYACWAVRERRRRIGNYKRKAA